MSPQIDKLSQFIGSNPEPRELKRAIAVQMRLEGYTYKEVERVLQVSAGFISQWQQAYQAQGVAGLKLAYKGSTSYLDARQRQAVIDWLKERKYWHLPELEQHIEATSGVVFKSKQSYYELFQEAGISWKKTQRTNPRKDPELVEKKTGNHELAGSASS